MFLVLFLNIPRMHSLGLKSNCYSRHVKFNHLSAEEDMLKHRRTARESNLVLPNSKKEVVMVYLFCDWQIFRDPTSL